MFGHVAERQHPSRWLILSFLFAVAIGWSFASTDVPARSPWDFLRVVSAVALTLSLLRLGVMLMAFRRRRRARKGDANADGAVGTEVPTEEPRRTYGEIFGTQQDPDATSEHEGSRDGDVDAPDGSVDGDVDATTEQGDGEADATIEQGESDGDADAPIEDDGSVDDDLAAPDDQDEQVAAIQADLEAQEALRRMRDEFKARAKEAELRVKQREAAELEQAETSQTSS